jgi:hypothetical protein
VDLDGRFHVRHRLLVAIPLADDDALDADHIGAIAVAVLLDLERYAPSNAANHASLQAIRQIVFSIAAKLHTGLDKPRAG